MSQGLTLREHTRDDGTFSTAVFSECGAYRYLLTRHWGAQASLNFIMLNPSKANERSNDPTIARCEKRARLLGFGGIEITNLFAFCATDPADLRQATVPEGPANRLHVEAAADRAGMVLAAWGVHGRHLGQSDQVLDWLQGRPLHVLGLTRHGLPRHPLYVGYAARPAPWVPQRVNSH